MKTAALLAALATLAMAPVAVAGDGAIEWQTDYQQALAAAQQTGKPLMVKFFATW